MFSDKRILAVDDHALFRRGLKLLLGNIFKDGVIKGAGNVDEAITLIDALPDFDLILLDLSMPGMAGLEGLERIRAKAPDARIVMLSAYPDPDSIRGSIKRGARGYMLKSFTEEKLKLALSLIMTGETFVPSIMAADEGAGSALFGQNDESAYDPANLLATLTPRQRDVLRLIVDGQPNRMIADNLGLKESTVKAHTKVILGKLDARNRTHAAMIAAGLGLSSIATDTTQSL